MWSVGSVPVTFIRQQPTLDPTFYGHIPTKSLCRQLLVVFDMFAMALCNLIVRSITYVSLSKRGTGTVIFVLMAELGLLLLVKISRHDFLDWIPVYGPTSKAFMLLQRITVGVVTHWTTCVQVRTVRFSRPTQRLSCH